MKKIEKKCPVCGKKVKNKDMICCSSECDELYQKKKKICIFCGNEFYPEHPLKKCCSDICTLERHRQQQAEHESSIKKYRTDKRKAEPVVYDDRVCPVCGETFTPKYYNQKCCSNNKCKNYYKNHKQDEEKKRKKYTADDLYNIAESVHCKVCGTLFLPKKKGDMFCGDACEINYNTVKPAKIEKAFMDNDPWVSGRFSSEITDNQFTGLMI